MTLKKSSLLLCLSLIPFTAKAMITPQEPDHCPSISSLKAAGFDIAESNTKFNWEVWKLNTTYNTNAAWDFGIALQAKDSTDAFYKAKAALLTMSDLEGPILSDDGSYWVCSQIMFDDKGNYTIAAATTPGQHSKYRFR